ncbi:hypothetical protein RG903_04840 [Thermithiobacillus tepidarius DSM 3134]|nr:hypothetical protein [Thermithiobacillus tepidarius]
MRLFHFHPWPRNGPEDGIQIKFPPLRLPQFARSQEHQGRQSQDRGDHERPGKPIDGAKQTAHARRIGDGSEMPFSDRRQRAPEIGGDVPIRPPRGDGITKNLPAGLQCAVGGVQRAALDAADDLQQLRWRDLADRTVTEPGKHVFL